MSNDIDWQDWNRRLQQALGALLAETVGAREPGVEQWDLVQGAIELEAEAHAVSDANAPGGWLATLLGLPLWITERHVDMTKGHAYNVVDWYETRFTGAQRRELYKSLAKEYGRASSMYRDKPDGGAVQVGWVFQKRVPYEDSKDTYLREVWVEVSVQDPRRPATARARSPWAR